MSGCQEEQRLGFAPSVNQHFGTESENQENKNKIDFIGKRFGRLIVVEFHSKRGTRGRLFWVCKCDCGNNKIVNQDNLVYGNTSSCGCFKKELHTTHGMTASPEYSVWEGIKARCENKNTPNYNNYGGRGIKVYKEWSESFEKFYKDMGRRPTGKYTIERKNNNGNYEPGNCKWATYAEQGQNKRIRADNKLGINGVDWVDKEQRYRVRIWADKALKSTRYFKLFADAVLCRIEMEKKYWNK
jgi:hypothetical protein